VGAIEEWRCRPLEPPGHKEIGVRRLEKRMALCRGRFDIVKRVVTVKRA
jgi:hypothetical protein